MRDVVSLIALLALTACCPAKPRPLDPPAATAATAAPTAVPLVSASGTAPLPQASQADPVVARAAELVALATKVEPSVTPLLLEIATAHGAEMVKLEFRLKSKASTERKIRKLIISLPSLTAATVRIDDALRYTMRVDDEPPGRYVEAAKASLAALEVKGHVVQYVKNYWPRDDNYSGINSVLKDESGLLWELQFHTSQSTAAQSDTRAGYEEMRKVETPLARQRELFDAMTLRWNKVPVPQGVLEQGALHAKDQVRDRARP